MDARRLTRTGPRDGVGRGRPRPSYLTGTSRCRQPSGGRANNGPRIAPGAVELRRVGSDQGWSPNVAGRAMSSGWSSRYTPPLPPQFGLWPHEVTATMSVDVVLSNVGPPESPKQVPPVAVLFEMTMYAPAGWLVRLSSFGCD